jgi:hypothetical protein
VKPASGLFALPFSKIWCFSLSVLGEISEFWRRTGDVRCIVSAIVLHFVFGHSSHLVGSCVVLDAESDEERPGSECQQ